MRGTFQEDSSKWSGHTKHIWGEVIAQPLWTTARISGGMGEVVVQTIQSCRSFSERQGVMLPRGIFYIYIL
jgi:hypothetical protein